MMTTTQESPAFSSLEGIRLCLMQIAEELLQRGFQVHGYAVISVADHL